MFPFSFSNTFSWSIEHRHMVNLRTLRGPTTQLLRILGVKVKIEVQNSKTVPSLQWCTDCGQADDMISAYADSVCIIALDVFSLAGRDGGFCGRVCFDIAAVHYWGWISEGIHTVINTVHVLQLQIIKWSRWNGSDCCLPISHRQRRSPRAHLSTKRSE